MKSAAHDKDRGLSEAPESRQHTRRETTRPADFVLADGTRHSGICRNIGLGGLQIDTDEPAPFGAAVTVLIELEGIDGPTELAGTVRWVGPNSMGVQLGLFGARVTHAILRMVSDR
jgi:hypothetical protein